MAPRQALDFQEIVDKAIKVAFHAFRSEFLKLMGQDRLGVGVRVDMPLLLSRTVVGLRQATGLH